MAASTYAQSRSAVTSIIQPIYKSQMFYLFKDFISIQLKKPKAIFPF
jgi:hypothetical protein